MLHLYEKYTGFKTRCLSFGFFFFFNHGCQFDRRRLFFFSFFLSFGRVLNARRGSVAASDRVLSVAEGKRQTRQSVTLIIYRSLHAVMGLIAAGEPQQLLLRHNVVTR